MAGHPQSSPRIFWAVTKLSVNGQDVTANSTAIQLEGGLALSGVSTSQITQDTTGVILAGSLRVSAKSTSQITQDTTGIILAGPLQLNAALRLAGNSTGIVTVSDTDTAGLAGNIAAGNIQIGANSTGATFIAVRTTGTTWKFLNVTTVLPT